MENALVQLRQHRTIPALRLKHRSGSCGTASALPKCSIMSGCGTHIALRGQKPLALCDRCPCFGSLFPPLAALTFAASSIICAFGLVSAAPRSPYRHLELCGIALSCHHKNYSPANTSSVMLPAASNSATRKLPAPAAWSSACSAQAFQNRAACTAAVKASPDRKSTRLNSSHNVISRMPSSA